jgi:hypothetical protein
LNASRRLIVLAAALCGAFVLSTGIWMLVRDKQPTMRADFNSDAWRANDPSAPRGAERGAMISDLFRRHPLRGMTRPDVEALLGPPDVPTWSDVFPRPAWRLGVAEGYDEAGLILEFDEDSRVANVLCTRADLLVHLTE